MKTLTDSAVEHAALLLIEAYGKTTSLDVKNHLRNLGFWAEQRTVSEKMQTSFGDLNGLAADVLGDVPAPLLIETVFDPVPHQVYSKNPAFFKDDDEEPNSVDAIADLYRFGTDDSTVDVENELNEFVDTLSEIAEQISGDDLDSLKSATVLKLGPDGEVEASYDLLSDDGIRAFADALADEVAGASEEADEPETDDDGITASDTLSDKPEQPLSSQLIAASCGKYTSRDGTEVYVFKSPASIALNGGVVYRESYGNGFSYYYAQNVTRELARGAHAFMTGGNYNNVRSRAYAA